MEFNIFDEMQKNGWNLWEHQQQYRHNFNLDNLELQSISRQISIIRYFSKNMNQLPPNYSPISFSNAMKQPPMKFLSKFSTHVYIYLHDWLVKMISYPRTMSSIFTNCFTREDARLSFFANVTFPSIFHNFATDEFHKAGASLVNYIILNQPPYLIKAFMLSFIGISTDFFFSLWQNFELEESLYEEKNRQHPIERPEYTISIFISSLSKSLVFLSDSQINLFKSLLNRSKIEFGRIILRTLFPNSYIDYFRDKVKDPRKTRIFIMLQSAGCYPDSPFFNKIVETITSPKFTKTRPSHRDSGLINQTPIVLSLHELYVIQQIIFNGSKIRKTKIENEDTNSKINPTSDNFDIDQVIMTKIKKGFFFFPPEVCKYKLEPLYIDLDLTSFIGKTEEPIENLLFSGSFKRKQMISEDNDQTKNVIQNKSTTQFMKDFDLYLAHRSLQKYYKSMIKEKKFYLFIILGSYSIQCIEHSNKVQIKDHNNIMKPDFNIFDPLHLFTPHNKHRNNNNNNNYSGDSNDNHYTLSIFNIKFHSSVSISNLNQATRFSSSGNENKIEMKYEKDKENNKDNSKIHNDLKELKLNSNTKEYLKDLLKKFSKPDDEISMFVLLRQLDEMESASNDSKECTNESDDLNEIELIQNFKKSIEKLNNDSEKLIEKIDQNGYYRKYIKICALKIDNLADQSHFEMITGLFDVGLELNEISTQISKIGQNNSSQNLAIMKSFFNYLFMQSNDKMFDVFMWYHKFINSFPEIKKVIPREARFCIDFLVNYFFDNYNSEVEKK